MDPENHSQRVSQKIKRNTVFNIVGRGWEALLGFVLTPYIVHKLGMNAWGLWAILSAFIGYMGLFDLGVASAYSKYIAEHNARHEDVEISVIVSTGVIFYLILGIIITACGWYGIHYLTQILFRLNMTRAGDLGRPEMVSELAVILRWIIVLFVCSNCVSAFTAVQTGLQRMDLTNIMAISASITKALSIVVLLQMRTGIKGLLYAEWIGFGTFSLLSIWASYLIFPQLHCSLTNFKFQVLKKLINYGWKTQIARFSNLVMFQTDKLVTGIVYRQLGLVGLYDLGVRLANIARQVPALLVSALVPAVSDLDARGEYQKVSELFLRSTKYVTILSAPLTIFLVVNADLALRVWVGNLENLTIAAWVLRIISVGYFANILAGPGVTVVLGKGKPDLQMYAGLISASSNIILTILLVILIGFYGIPIATTLSIFISCIWFFYTLRHLTEVSLHQVIRQSLLRPLLAATLGVGPCFITNYLPNYAPTRWHAGLLLIISLIFSSLLYLFLLRILKVFDETDAKLLSILPNSRQNRLIWKFFGVFSHVL